MRRGIDSRPLIRDALAIAEYLNEIADSNPQCLFACSPRPTHYRSSLCGYQRPARFDARLSTSSKTLEHRLTLRRQPARRHE